MWWARLLNVISGLLSGGAAAGGGTSYESIATVTVGSGGTSYIEFTSIPSTFKHLQLRGISQTNRATYNTSALKVVLNGDTAANYSSHILSSDPASPSTSAVAGGAASQTSIAELSTSSSVASNVFGASVVDILDYTNTNKYKTIRFLSGADTNGAASGYAGWIGFGSGAWLNTTAVTNVRFYPQFGTTINQYSSFALYGIKG
jgi:hypothetical protein